MIFSARQFRSSTHSNGSIVDVHVSGCTMVRYSFSTVTASEIFCLTIVKAGLFLYPQFSDSLLKVENQGRPTNRLKGWKYPKETQDQMGKLYFYSAYADSMNWLVSMQVGICVSKIHVSMSRLAIFISIYKCVICIDIR